MSARIAAVVPVGYLDRMGYQHNHLILFENWQAADWIFTVDSVNGRIRCADWISNEATRFARKPDGSYWFDAYRVMENVNVGIERVKNSDFGFDAAIVLMCNNYIWDAELLYAMVDRMLEDDLPFIPYCRLDQLGDQLFGPSVKLPWIVNLRHKADLRFSVDCLVVDGVILNMQRGDYEAKPIVCDVQLELTREDLAEKMNFIRCYSDLVPKRNPVFDWGYWFPYYVDKFKKKQRRPDLELTETGKAIAANSRPDFVSHEVLKCLG